MGQKTIADLNSLPKADLSDNDLLLITDLSDKETKNIEVSEFEGYIISKLDKLYTGSFTGSFYGKLYGTAITSSNSNLADVSTTSSVLSFNGNVNGTASYALSSSNSFYSISSSVSTSSSYSISSSYTYSSSFTNTTSSTYSKTSLYSLYSKQSDISITSSYINYYGQNNGTVHSSSFSEICNFSEIVDNVVDKASSIVRHANEVNESNLTDKSATAITSSTSDVSVNADSALTRLFSSLEFRVDTDKTNKKLNITPLSWKNIKNIAAGNIGNLYTDFYVTYKKRPPFPENLQDLAYNLATVTVASFSLNNENIIKNVPVKKPVPVFTSYVFPCGTDGYVIRFVNCTLYGEQRNGTWFNALAGIVGLGSNTRSTPSTNNAGPVYWDIQLNGVTVSAQTFCNTVNFLEMGPPSSPISQFRYNSDKRFSAGTKSLTKGASFFGFPQSSSALNGIFNWYTPQQQTQLNLQSDISYNVVTSIAHNSGSSYNLLLLENDTYKPLSFGSQIALVNGKNFYYNSLHYPKTGSSVSASLKDANYIYYNTSSGEYLCVGDSKILFTGSNHINYYTGSTTYGTQLYSSNLNNILPIWKYYDTNIVGCNQIGHISGNRYLLLTKSNYNLKNPGSATGPMPIYIIPDITNQSTPLIQCQDLPGTDGLTLMTKTVERILGNVGDVPEVPPTPITVTNKYNGDQRKVTINNTIFRKLCVLDNSRAVVAGDNGVIVYSNNINTSSPKWIRIDQLANGQPNNAVLIERTTEYLQKINDIFVIYPGSIETLIVSGQDISNRACMIGCEVPKNPNDTIVKNWSWQGIPGVYNQTTLDADDNGVLLPSQIGNSSINVTFRDNYNTIAAGFSTFPTSSYYRYGINEFYPYIPGLYNVSSVINAIGKIGTDQYIFGGKNILDLYEIT